MAPAKKTAVSSEASSKPQKLPSSFDPLTTFFEKKLRNLEKRKGKLESYKQLQKDGKLTDSGQQQAVEKYDSVVMSIGVIAELHQELLPIILEVGANVEKELNLKEKEAISRSKAAVKSVLNIQDLFDQLGDDSVREDFLKGNSNAKSLTDSEIEIIDKLYEVSKPSRSKESGNFITPAEYNKALTSSTDDWYRLVTKSTAPFAKSQYKYEDLFELFNGIGTSPYFDPSERAKLAAVVEPVETQVIEESQTDPDNCHDEPASEVVNDLIVANGHPQESVLVNSERKRTASEVLGSLQEKAVVSFVQDDVQRNDDDPAVILAHPMAPGSMLNRNPAFPANNIGRPAFENTQFDTFTIHPNNNLEPQYGHYTNNENLYPAANDVNLMGITPAPQTEETPAAAFNTQQSWADEVAGDSFDTHLNAPDSFVEVKYSQRGATRGGPGGRGDFKADGGRGGRYRDDFNRGANNRSRGGFDSNMRGGYDSRGSFNRPYRNDYPRDNGDGGTVYRPRDDINRSDRNRPFPGKQDMPRGQPRGGGKPRNFERPYNQGRE